MFGLSLPCQLIQGPAVRTWNCVAHFVNLIWCKLNYIKDPAMPRSRRRHHSRSRTRSRSRSQSCDKDRDTKRRKIDNCESPHKGSDSRQDENTNVAENPVEQEQNEDVSNSPEVVNSSTELDEDENLQDTLVTNKLTSAIVTPKKPMTPKQMHKKLLSEEKRKERDRIKEDKLKVLEEKKKIKQGELEKKTAERQKKIEQRQKELEEKQKIKEMKEEKKKKEREEKEMKRKEKEEKEEQRRKEQMEKSMEKQKMVEKKEKTAAAFVNFFTKKSEAQTEEKLREINNTSAFMPFEVKSDMRLAPRVRVILDDRRKSNVLEALDKQVGCTYLEELRSGKKVGKGGKTWFITESNDDIIILDDVNPGESIEEQPKSTNKMRAKFLKFDGNRRPAYYGTWRKKSTLVKPRKPFAVDIAHFDYDVDSDEDWEEDDSGESLRGSDDDKENDSENEYEEDNEFFVPHGHLSDDEVDDEENVSLEAHKAKLKLLKTEFEHEMRSKTEKIKPRVIGCIWYNKDGSNVDSAIDGFLKPFSIISNGTVVIKKRSKFSTPFIVRRSFVRGKELDEEFVPGFLKFIHGSTTNGKALVGQFLSSLSRQNLNVEVSKTSLLKKLKKFASWTRNPDGAPPLKKHCWFVRKNFSEEYNIELPCLN